MYSFFQTQNGWASIVGRESEDTGFDGAEAKGSFRGEWVPYGQEVLPTFYFKLLYKIGQDFLDRRENLYISSICYNCNNIFSKSNKFKVSKGAKSLTNKKNVSMRKKHLLLQRHSFYKKTEWTNQKSCIEQCSQKL